jgi:hypothetical protein
MGSNLRRHSARDREWADELNNVGTRMRLVGEFQRGALKSSISEIERDERRQLAGLRDYLMALRYGMPPQGGS